MDGELHDASAADLVADGLQDWHCYHLIGDVLRSPDLASAAPADSALLLALRARLATEPAIVAAAANQPGPGGQTVMPRTRHHWTRAWSAPVAAAAGFMVVAGVTWHLRTGPAGEAAPAPQAAASLPSEEIRQARLDRYLHAHRAWAQGLAADAPTAQRMQLVHETH